MFAGLRHTTPHISHPTFHEVDREKVLLDGQVRELELELVLGRAVRRDRQTADERDGLALLDQAPPQLLRLRVRLQGMVQILAGEDAPTTGELVGAADAPQHGQKQVLGGVGLLDGGLDRQRVQLEQVTREG